jgi:polypyrimidine tract-binding protein 2
LSFDCLAQPAVGAVGRKGDAQGNVLLASNENMQYVVTVDDLQTVSKIVNTI